MKARAAQYQGQFNSTRLITDHHGVSLSYSADPIAYVQSSNNQKYRQTHKLMTHDYEAISAVCKLHSLLLSA